MTTETETLPAVGAQRQDRTVLGQKLARVAAAEAELVGVTAERDALRTENETLLEESQTLSRNLDEALAYTDAHLGYHAARWFTAADAEPDDERLELCSPHDGIVFTRTVDGYWRTPHLSHIYFDWQQVCEYAPLLAVDSHANRETLAQLDRRRRDEQTLRSALWNAERALRSHVEVRGIDRELTDPLLVELVEQIKELGKVRGFQEDAPSWSDSTATALAATANVLAQLHSRQRALARQQRIAAAVEQPETER